MILTQQFGKIDKFYMCRITIAFFAILLIGCHTQYGISKYAQYNRTQDIYYNTFINDSLKISIDFLGIHFLDSVYIKKDFASKINTSFIRKFVRNNKLKFLFKYKTTASFQNNCYAYILDNKYVFDTTNFDSEKSIGGDTIYFSKKTQIQDNKEMLLCGTNIGTKTLFLLYTQGLNAKILLPIKFKANEELETIRAVDNFQSFIAGRNKISEIIIGAYNNGNSYIADKKALLSIPIDSISKYDLERPYYQSLISTLSFFDDLTSMRKYNDEYHQYLSKSNAHFKLDTNTINQKENAIRQVLLISKNERMLMINESHYDFRNRLFVYMLLDSLYKNGYRNFCLEDRRSNTGIFNSKFPSKNDGFYIKEPFMASLVRRAIKLGFNIYGYDENTGDFDEREKQQAQNLFNLYKRDTINKWLVLAGYAHVNKFDFGSYKSAYQNFVDLAGFRPYSINQSYFSDIINQDYKISKDSVGFFFINGDSTKEELKQSDLYIVNNISQNPYEQPFYPLSKSLGKFQIDFRKQIAPNYFCFIYVKDEYLSLGKNAVPVYIGMFASLKDRQIFLPNDIYMGIALDNDDALIDTVELKPI